MERHTHTAPYLLVLPLAEPQVYHAVLTGVTDRQAAGSAPRSSRAADEGAARAGGDTGGRDGAGQGGGEAAGASLADGATSGDDNDDEASESSPQPQFSGKGASKDDRKVRVWARSPSRPRHGRPLASRSITFHTCTYTHAHTWLCAHGSGPQGCREGRTARTAQDQGAQEAEAAQSEGGAAQEAARQGLAL